MSFLESIFFRSEGLGKKYDDHRPGKEGALPSSWAPRRSMPGFRRRRVFFAVVACLLIYLFIHNLPAADFGSDLPNEGTRVSSRGSSSSVRQSPPKGRPPHHHKPLEGEDQYYEGAIKFYNLAISLQRAAGLGGSSGVNKNVLFAASSLQSASAIIPVACEMARWNRNHVHFALMGRDDLDIEEIKALNGIGDEDCNIHWHDARPDYAHYSSNFRMEVSVTASLGHLQTFLHPQVIITDHADREDDFFTKSVRSKAEEIGKSVIELPLDALENLMWITRLDSGSLAAWHTTYIDLVIHAPPKSSGSLLRLLKSIQAADYFGARRPHITIELPAEIDPPTLDFLDDLVWPPTDRSGAPHASQVTLRHRLPRYGFTTEEAATHFIESFYPARSRESHVLLLSPQTELSPIYYHYIMYNVLEYQYSRYGQQAHQSENLMGISLELPSSYLNYSKPFKPPTLNLIKSNDSPDESSKQTPFLWQAPNSNAALYFGEKWIELHSYLSSRISLQDPELPENRRPPARQKIISEYFPAWMEYVQELMRARGYSLLYPNFAGSNDAIATVHDELYQPPEEYTPSRPRSSSAPIPTINPNDPFTADPATHLSNRPTSPESLLLVSSLMSLLPEPGDLPELTELPFLAFDGNALSPSLSESTARSFAEEFRREIGGCKDNHEAIVEPMSADDLFCSLDSSEDIPSAGNDPQINGHQKEEKKTDNEPKNKKSSVEVLDRDTAQKSSHRPTGRRAQGRVGASTEAKHRLDDSLPPADQSKQAQNEFTEHLKRQGVKSANKTPVKVGGKKGIPNASPIDPKPRESEKVTNDGESDTEFETVNGNLVRKKGKDSDQNTLGKEENIPLAEPTLDIATDATVNPTVTATTEEKGQDQLEKKDSRPAKAKNKDPAGAAGVPVVRDRGW